VLQKVTVGRWALDSYDGIAPPAIMAELREHAQALRGARILHVNATAYGGGVSELLRSSVPLLRDLGLVVDWKVIGGNPDFFHATKALHNALQGAPRPLNEAEQAAYRQCNEENAATLDGDYDFIVIHDPQLALVGSMALDDPEGWEVYQQVSDAAERDPLIHIYTNLTGVGNVEVNAFQRLSEVIVQKSIREGFGLVVSESLWKGTPVVAGRAGGIPLQMPGGVGGRLVQSTEECATAMLELLQNRRLAAELGQRGREHVREHFLLPRLLMQELGLLRSLAGSEPALSPASPVRT
jgi:glycosyltransferase involved in cell wall biosynthesis